MPDNWIRWAMDIENTHRGLVNIFKYIFRKNGGLLWPLVYASILWQSWGIWNVFGQISFVIIGCLLTVVAFFYPITWESYIRQRDEQIRKIEVSLFGSSGLIPLLETNDLWQYSREKKFDKQLEKMLEDIQQLLQNLRISKTTIEYIIS